MGLPYRVLNIYLAKPEKGRTAETIGRTVEGADKILEELIQSFIDIGLRLGFRLPVLTYTEGQFKI